MHGSICFNKLITDYKFDTVLDVGAGDCLHTKLFRKSGKAVTPIDIKPVDGGICGDYMMVDIEKHDCGWCCHVLEHQLNVNNFLRKLSRDIKDGGIIAITVPPAKPEVVGGHYTIWNAGLLIYNLVMAKINCRNIQIKSYDYNISAIVRNNKIKLPDNLGYDCGDIEKLDEFLPPFLTQSANALVDEYNWDGML